MPGGGLLPVFLFARGAALGYHSREEFIAEMAEVRKNNR